MDKIRALIVDDSSVMRKIVERSIRQAGIDLVQVMEAGNDAEALGIVKDCAVDLILCDINMPVMDGLEFVKQLQAMEVAKRAPVVMITTEGSESHVVQALSFGAKGYIRKPFTPDQVKEHVIPVLERHTHETSNGRFHCRTGPRDVATFAATGGRGSIRDHACAKLEPLTGAQSVPASEITAMVGWAGQLCGVMTLRCTIDTAKVIAAKMFGIAPDQANQQVWDAIGEICNMVAGNFKNKLTGLSDKYMLSVPTVITGGDYTVHSLADAGTMEIVMTFENSPVLIALEVHS